MKLADEIYLEKDNETDPSYVPDKSDPGLINALRLIFPNKYSLDDMRHAYLTGKKIGYEMGIYKGSPEGRMVELSTNMQDKNEKEFYDKFLELCVKHNIRITYHPQRGMCFENLR